MASETKIAANRRNAERSTGPKTERGKAMSAQNALRHGLGARKVISFDEKEPDFIAFHAEQREAFQPADAIEEHLVERIAMCAWRLRRLYRVEAEMFDTWQNVTPRRLEDLEIGAVFEYRPESMARISRYEIAIDRALHRAYVMLERRQARRRGEDVAAPLTVEVTGEIANEIEGLAAVETLERLRESENFQTKPNSSGESASETETTRIESGSRNG
jgi:hypothetical protein